MVLAATLVMIICMTFRIPYAFQAAIYVLLISRESIRDTLQTGAIVLLVTAIGTVYLLVSAWFVINLPPLHFLWIVGSLFLAFYGVSALGNYIVGVIFAVMISVGVPLWDRQLPAETNVEDTLWLCLATLVGFAASVGVALAFARLRPGDEVASQITERLSAVVDLLMCYADRRAVDADTEQRVMRLTTLGTSLLRRILRRSDYSPQYRANMTGVAVVVGRLVDLAAALMQLRFEPSAADQKRLRNLALAVASIRSDLMSRAIPGPIHLDTDEQSSGAVPLLGEMERTIALIPKAFLGSRSIQEYMPSSEDSPRPALLAPDAVANPKHLHFALKGCLAATGSYVIYNAIDWPEISTAVTTCLLTALSTVGASHQKQILRITGAIMGGFVLGMGSQIFILPYIDSIGGFTILFVLVTALSSWVLTSSPRLSYFGLQTALAFYLINLQEFKIQTSLAVARDRVVGILLGLFMMWLIFDRLWGGPAGMEMKKAFISSLRALARFAREPVSEDMKTGIARCVNLREAISASLSQVRDLADLVLFEFGPSRRRDLELREHIRRWQPHLRTLFLMRIASLKYRLHLPGFELPENVRLQHRAYDDRSARILEEMADRIEHDTSTPVDSVEGSHELLNTTIQEIQAEESKNLPDGRIESLVTLLREIDGLTNSLASDIAVEFGSRPRMI
jgi:multidrug resistance protein MdtO